MSVHIYAVESVPEHAASMLWQCEQNHRRSLPVVCLSIELCQEHILTTGYRLLTALHRFPVYRVISPGEIVLQLTPLKWNHTSICCEVHAS